MAVSKYTVGDLRARYHHLVTPGDPSSPKFLTALNELVERLLNDHPWKNATATLILPVDEDAETVSLPAEYEAIVQAQVDGSPKPLYTGSYEFIGYGDKDLDDGVDAVMVDLGDAFGTTVDVPSTAGTLSLAASNVGDTAPIRIYGLDDSGDEVYDASGIPGEELAPGGATTTLFSKVTGVRKPVTLGSLTLTHTASSTVLQVYLPWMTTPTFRRYHLVSEATTKVKARCRLRYVELQMEEQFVVPGNSGAIKNGLMALNYENENDLERSEIYWAKVKGLLNEELKATRGGAQVLPSINLWGEGIPPLRAGN